MTAISKIESLPILGPIWNLLKMQELFLALIALVINYVILLRPELEEVRTPLMVIATTLFGLLISGQLAARLQGLTGAKVWKAIFNPIWLLLQSRKFWMAFGSALTAIIVALIPELQDVQGELVAAIAAIGLAVIGSIAWEDTAKKKEGTPPEVVESPLPRLSDEEFARLTSAIVGSILKQFVMHPK